MGLIKFLPFNSIRYVVSELQDAKKQKKAYADAVKEAGLNLNNYWYWTPEQRNRLNTIGRRIFKERGIKKDW